MALSDEDRREFAEAAGTYLMYGEGQQYYAENPDSFDGAALSQAYDAIEQQKRIQKIMEDILRKTPDFTAIRFRRNLFVPIFTASREVIALKVIPVNSIDDVEG
jgi:hypothetical protein